MSVALRHNDVLVVTGAAGFIGSYLVGYLNQHGYKNLVLVDDFSDERKAKNLVGKEYLFQVHRDNYIEWQDNNPDVQAVFHLGARTDTTEMDYAIHKKLNLDYSIAVWKQCVKHSIPLIYASSAATYGNGEHGYVDSHDVVDQLHPLNPYGVSKNEFDKWALQQETAPPFWAGMKFFNVFGPNEYHKGRMASVIFHAFNQIREKGKVKLFRSHNPNYTDGGQIRDFVYVKDVASIALWLANNQPANGLYNVGTGKARTFNDLVRAIFTTLQLPERIVYIDTPLDIRDKYQYFTEADMIKLQHAGYTTAPYSLEAAVSEYVKEYLDEHKYA